MARKDANMKGVIMSERCDKKAAKYSTANLPYPFDSRVTYERHMRQPMGSDFNTTASYRCVYLCVCVCMCVCVCLCLCVALRDLAQVCMHFSGCRRVEQPS